MRRARVCLVGPLPPSSGGMGNQCQLMVDHLKDEQVDVELVQTNAAYVPASITHIPIIRAVCRLFPYLYRLWRTIGRCNVVHVLANSGWAWHLYAAPAIGIAKIRRVGVIVNYHGGNADSFLAHAPGHVMKTLSFSSLLVTPSPYLQRVFSQYGFNSEVIPNIVDLSRFGPSCLGSPLQPIAHIVITRSLEAVYDISTAIRALKCIRQAVPSARMTIAGTGPELENLKSLAKQLGLCNVIHFSGRLDGDGVAKLVQSASCLVNPSTVDNMPVSILEAFACGVPVVSTCAGGIPDMLMDGVAGLLVPVGDVNAMAQAVLRILQDPMLAMHLSSAGLEEAEKYSWTKVKRQWLNAYCRVAVSSPA